jgi:hypothetical protein
MSFRICNVTLDPATWQAITCPVEADNVLISNLQCAAALRLRTDQDDALTEILISAGAERSFTSPSARFPPVRERFQPGSTLFYLKPDSGVGPVVLVWA